MIAPTEDERHAQPCGCKAAVLMTLWIGCGGELIANCYECTACGRRWWRGL